MNIVIIGIILTTIGSYLLSVDIIPNKCYRKCKKCILNINVIIYNRIVTLKNSLIFPSEASKCSFYQYFSFLFITIPFLTVLLIYHIVIQILYIIFDHINIVSLLLCKYTKKQLRISLGTILLFTGTILLIIGACKK